LKRTKPVKNACSNAFRQANGLTEYVNARKNIPINPRISTKHVQNLHLFDTLIEAKHFSVMARSAPAISEEITMPADFDTYIPTNLSSPD